MFLGLIAFLCWDLVQVFKTEPARLIILIAGALLAVLGAHYSAVRLFLYNG